MPDCCPRSNLITFFSGVWRKVVRGEGEVVGGDCGSPRNEAEEDNECGEHEQGEAAMGHARRASLRLGSALENTGLTQGDTKRPIQK